MKVLFVSRSLPFHHIGGMEAVAWDLARALKSHGISVEILTTQCSTIRTQQEIEGIIITPIQAKSGRYSGRFWRSTIERFRSEYAASVDLVIGVGCGAYAIANARQREDPPIIMQSHGQAWGEFVSKLSVFNIFSWLKSPKNLLGVWSDRALARFDLIVAVGPAVATVLNSWPTRLLTRGVPIKVIPNGVDEAVFRFDAEARAELRRQLGIERDVALFMSASRLHAQKGLSEALRGFASARQSGLDAKYVIVGAGPHATVLEGEVTHLGLEGDVIFVGSVSRDDLPRYLSAADGFVFTSVRTEGLALGPLEASACGLPCIVSDHLVPDDTDFIPVSPRDVTSLARAMRSIAPVEGDCRASRLNKKYTLNAASQAYILEAIRLIESREV